MLREQPRGLDQVTVFCLTADQITAPMRLACKKALLENLRFHDLRLEATSRFFERTGLDVMEITVFAGHLKLWTRLFRLFADVFKMDIIFCI